MKMLKHYLSLEITLLINQIYYYFKRIPLIKKITPNSVLDNNIIKWIFTIIGNLVTYCMTICTKSLYINYLILFPLIILENINTSSILNVFLFLTLAGGIVNTKFFNPVLSKYYSIVILKLNAKKYIFTEYFFFIFKLFFGYIVGNIIIFYVTDITLFSSFKEAIIYSIIFPIFTIAIKNIFIANKLRRYEKVNNITSENNLTKTEWTLMFAFLVLGYGLVYINIIIPVQIYYVVFALILLLNIWAIKKILSFDKYKYLTKQLYSKNNFITFENATQISMERTKAKSIDEDTSITSNKDGYDYFNDIFVKRHKKMLTKTTNIFTLIIFFVFVMGIVISLNNTEFSSNAVNLILNSLPVLVIFIYFINRGQEMTQTIFNNCDSGLITYNFYKNKKMILEIFIRRIKTIALINLRPALVIAGGLMVLLLTSGVEVELYIYPLLLLTIVAISIFFTVHYLVLYYLLQPFTMELKIKNPTYYVITILTYYLTYKLIGVQISTIVFGVATLLFTIIYIIIAMILVYKYAPKTFRIK